jgi:hypothetical protein
VIGMLWVVLGPPATVSGQVGHDPARSPYRDVLAKQTVSFFGSHITGGRGDARVAPTNGTLFGARWDIRLGAPTLAFLAFSTGNLERTLVKPNEPPATRFFDTASQSMTIFDGGFNLVLTGKKSWHGLAPYAGVGLGVAVGGGVPQDSSGFKFKTKFQVGPSLGFRLFLGQTFHVRVEARDILWRVSYPDTFFEILDQPDLVTVLDPAVDGKAQWVHHPTFYFSVGYTLKR